MTDRKIKTLFLLAGIAAVLLLGGCHRHPAKLYLQTGALIKNDAVTFFSAEGVRTRVYGSYIQLPRSRKSFRALLKFSGYLEFGADLAARNISTVDDILVNEQGTYTYYGLSLEQDGTYRLTEETRDRVRLVYSPGHPEAHGNGYISVPAIDRQLEVKKMQSYSSLYNGITLMLEKERFWIIGMPVYQAQVFNPRSLP